MGYKFILCGWTIEPLNHCDSQPQESHWVGGKVPHKAGLSRSFGYDGLMLHYGLQVVDYKSQCKTIAVWHLRVSSMLGREPLIKLARLWSRAARKDWGIASQSGRVHYSTVEYGTV